MQITVTGMKHVGDSQTGFNAQLLDFA